MTNNLKCPWCGRKIGQWVSDEGELLYACRGYLVRECVACIKAPLSIWKEIIAGKAAQDALKEIKAICESGRYADTLNFNLDSTDIRNIYEIITKQESE